MKPARSSIVGINEGQNLGPITTLSGTVGAAKAAVAAGHPGARSEPGAGRDPARLPERGQARRRLGHGTARPRSSTGTADKNVVNLNVPTCTVRDGPGPEAGAAERDDRPGSRSPGCPTAPRPRPRSPTTSRRSSPASPPGPSSPPTARRSRRARPGPPRADAGLPACVIPLVVLMGVAGSGKSTIGPRLAAALGVPFVDGDDAHSDAAKAQMAAGRPLDDAERGPWLDRLHDILAGPFGRRRRARVLGARRSRTGSDWPATSRASCSSRSVASPEVLEAASRIAVTPLRRPGPAPVAARHARARDRCPRGRRQPVRRGRDGRRGSRRPRWIPGDPGQLVTLRRAAESSTNQASPETSRTRRTRCVGPLEPERGSGRGRDSSGPEEHLETGGIAELECVEVEHQLGRLRPPVPRRATSPSGRRCSGPARRVGRTTVRLGPDMTHTSNPAAGSRPEPRSDAPARRRPRLRVHRRQPTRRAEPGLRLRCAHADDPTERRAHVTSTIPQRSLNRGRSRPAPAADRRACQDASAHDRGASEHPARPSSGRSAGGGGGGRPAVPRRPPDRRVPRRRPVLRPVRLPHHLAPARRVARSGRVRLGGFWVRRARRLLPALVGLLAGVAVYCLVVAEPDELDQIRDDALATIGYVANWQAVFSGNDYWALFLAPSPLEHTWSLAIEEQFYLVWPLVFVGLLAWWKRRTPQAVLVDVARRSPRSRPHSCSCSTSR